MAESKHTPGPWKSTRLDRDDRILFWDIEEARKPDQPYRGGIGTIHAEEHIGGITIEERDANARLIAAAPELLSMLQECEEYFDNRADADCDQDGFIPNTEMRLLNAVREVLRKAGA